MAHWLFLLLSVITQQVQTKRKLSLHLINVITLFQWLTGNEELKLSGSPPREDRIAAIKQTAAQLKQRLETEAWILGLNLQPTSPRKPDEQLGTLTSTNEYAVFEGALPGM